jgi:predicted phage terminase large subunit-like protein
MQTDLSSLDITKLPVDGQRELLRLLEELEEARARERARVDFLSFIEHIWPDFIGGRHHRDMAQAFERVLSKGGSRLIINMPPRHTKSEFASVHLPAWFLGKYPKKKIIQATHTAELAVGFGRRVRNILRSDEYQEIFEDVSLSIDSKASGRWSTNAGGEYFAIGVGGAVAGRGADLLVIDDPIDEQTAQYGEYKPEVYDKINEWYSLLRQRLQPNASVILVQTRWSKRDLTGYLIKQMIDEPGADQWELIEFPAILPSGSPLWPEYWKIDELEKTKASIPVSRWNAQYQQDPTAEEGALIKREWWREWDNPDPPQCYATLVSWDTAFEKTQRSDYSACTTWGVFDGVADDGRPRTCLMLLDAFRGKWEFPELKAIARKHHTRWDPDMTIIEAKASGSPLIYELRAMGIPVTEFKPTKGNDKIVRVNSVTDLFSSGHVYAPPKKWAEEVIEECAGFPASEHDDYVDTVSQALIRFRKGGFIRIDPDEDEDDDDFYLRYHRKAAYY